MAAHAQDIARGPQYVAEPAFVHNSLATEVPSTLLSKNIGSKFSPYYPGAMLAETAFMSSGYGPQFGDVAFMDEMHGASLQVTAGEANDPEAESDCSTTDTANEMSMQMTSSDGSTLGNASAYMMPDMGMLAEGAWPQYPGSEYWMPYPPMASQPQQTWSQMPMAPSAGSGAHILGKCKPCAFMYKDGCRSGSDCPYCHLCPPGEKQRRKRVMRAMQRSVGV